MLQVYSQAHTAVEPMTSSNIQEITDMKLIPKGCNKNGGTLVGALIVGPVSPAIYHSKLNSMKIMCKYDVIFNHTISTDFHTMLKWH